MKQLVMALCAVLATTSSQAQVFGFGLGYNFNFIQPDSLNFVVQRYNETRSWLDEEMSPIQMTHGVTLNMQSRTPNGLFLDMGYNWQRARTHAQGTAPATGSLARRDVRLKMDTYHLGLGLGLSAGAISVNGGAALELGNVKVQTRVAAPEAIGSEKWLLAVKSFQLYGTPFIQLLFGSPDSYMRLAVQPYYRLAPFVVNFYGMNEAINPATYTNDPEVLESRLGGFGLKALLVVLLSN